MADTITEFINVSGQKLSQLADPGITLLTNNASETAVIKDVVVNNPKGRTLAFKVGVNDIFQVSGSTRLSGTELIGASSTVKLVSRSTPVFNRYTNVSYDVSPAPSTSANITATTVLLETIFTDSMIKLGSRSKQTSQVVGARPKIIPNWSCFDQAGNFYYATVTDTAPFYNTGGTGANVPTTGLNVMYRRAGGVAGAETAIMSFGTYSGATQYQNFTYDGNRYIHAFWMTNSTSPNSVLTFSTYDTQTGNVSTMTSTATGIDPASTFSGSIAAVDNFIFYNAVNVSPNTNSGIYVFNHITKTLAGFVFHGLNAASNYMGLIFAGKNSLDEYIASAGVYSQGMAGYNFGTDLNNGFGAVNRVNIANVNTYVVPQRDVGYYVKSATSQRFIYYGRLGALAVVDLDALKYTPIYTSPLGGATMIQPISVPIPDATFAESDFGEVGIRVTGIKTT